MAAGIATMGTGVGAPSGAAMGVAGAAIAVLGVYIEAKGDQVIRDDAAKPPAAGTAPAAPPVITVKPTVITDEDEEEPEPEEDPDEPTDGEDKPDPNKYPNPFENMGKEAAYYPGPEDFYPNPDDPDGGGGPRATGIREVAASVLIGSGVAALQVTTAYGTVVAPGAFSAARQVIG